MTTQLDCLFQWAATAAAEVGKVDEVGIEVTVKAPNKNWTGNCTYTPAKFVSVPFDGIPHWIDVPAQFSGTIFIPDQPTKDPDEQQLVLLSPPINALGQARYTAIWAGEQYPATSDTVDSCPGGPPFGDSFSIPVVEGGFSGQMVFYYSPIA